ncbi:VOC family protein [Arthrobacter pigmenti]
MNRPDPFQSAGCKGHTRVHVWVKDLDDGERQVLDIGAVKQGYEEDDFRVYIDPAGHPFCLVTTG